MGLYVPNNKIETAQHEGARPMIFKLREEIRDGFPVLEANVGVSTIGFDVVHGPITNEPNGDLVPVVPHVEVASRIRENGRQEGAYMYETLEWNNMLVGRYCGHTSSVPNELDGLIGGEHKEVAFAGPVMARLVMRDLRLIDNPKSGLYGRLLKAALIRLFDDNDRI